MKYFKYLGLSLLLFSSFFGMGQTVTSVSSTAANGTYTDTGGIVNAHKLWRKLGTDYYARFDSTWQICPSDDSGQTCDGITYPDYSTSATDYPWEGAWNYSVTAIPWSC